MSPIKIAVAGRYQDRATIREQIRIAGLDREPFELTASWITNTQENDAAMTDEQAMLQAQVNVIEIVQADALLYFPCFNALGEPFWSPGRLIDFGIAMATCVPIIVVGPREPTMYQRGELVTSVRAPTEIRPAIEYILRITPTPTTSTL